MWPCYLVDLHKTYIVPLVVDPRLLLQSVDQPVGHGAQHRQCRLQVAAKQHRAVHQHHGVSAVGTALRHQLDWLLTDAIS